MNIQIQGVNSSSGLDLCDGDEKIYLSSLRLYVSNIPGTLGKIRNVSEKTLKDYTVSVHGIKGMSDYIGAIEARDTAKKLEEMAKNGDLAGVLAQNEQFISNIENIISNIKKWLKNNDTLKS